LRSGSLDAAPDQVKRMSDRLKQLKKSTIAKLDKKGKKEYEALVSVEIEKEEGKGDFLEDEDIGKVRSADLKAS